MNSATFAPSNTLEPGAMTAVVLYAVIGALLFVVILLLLIILAFSFYAVRNHWIKQKGKFNTINYLLL